MRAFRILPVICAVLLLGSAGSATARSIIKDGSPGKDRPFNLDFSLGAYYDAVGGAVNFAIPIVPDGFIGAINDSFDLEFGVLTMYRWGVWRSRAFFVTPLAGVRWKFHLTEDWTVFAQTKFGWRIPFAHTRFLHRFALQGGLGAYWTFSDGLWMRFDVASEFTGVGLSIPL